MRLGILGGAFNPPHIGHLVCAQESLLALELGGVMFVPTARPPHRELEDDPGAEERCELTRLAVDGDERFSVSRIELEREGLSYTSDTLRELRAQRPGDELFLLLGGDRAASLPDWHEPDVVLELATVCVFSRSGFDRDGVAARLAGLPGAERVRYLELPVIEVSSTLLRERVATGRPIRYLVPEAVERRIAERGLYRRPARVGAR